MRASPPPPPFIDRHTSRWPIQVLNGDGDFSVGSRNVDGGEVAGWTLTRKVNHVVDFVAFSPPHNCTINV